MRTNEIPTAWPLPGHAIEVPIDPMHPGSFGAVRKHDRHTGIDLYVPEGTEAVAIEEGIVVAIDETFTGGDDTPKDAAGMPVWLPTQAVLVEGTSGVILYGEIMPAPGIVVGVHVSRGTVLGTVLRVLRPKPDGRPYSNPANSPSMLHLELYAHGSRKAVFWQLDEPQPEELIDPSGFLASIEV